MKFDPHTTPGRANNTSKDLAAALKTQRIKAHEVQVGDIIVDPLTVWQVVRIYKWKNGGLELCEIDGLHGLFGPDEINDLVTIIDRSCLIPHMPSQEPERALEAASMTRFELLTGDEG